VRVFVVDPSLFTPQYDAPLCAALQALHDVDLVCRPSRADEVDITGPYRVRRLFYAVSERLRRTRLAPLAGPAKVLEHVVDLGRLAWRVRAERPDVVHVQWLVVPVVDRLAFLAMRRWAPVVLTVHDTTPMHDAARSALQTVGTSRALAAADHLVVHTEFSRNELGSAGLELGRITVVPLGQMAPVSATAGGRAGEGDEDGDGEDVRLLVFGRIRPYKGVDVLLSALARMGEPQRRRVRVHIAGSPLMDMEPLYRQAQELGVAGQVRWSPRFLDDGEVAACFAEADVAVLPYRDVDASSSLGVALAEGLPVIASRIGGFAELLTHGEDALLFEVDDADGLAGCIEEMLDPDRRRAIAAGAARLAGTVPTWAEIARRTTAVYDEVRAGHRAS